MNEICRNEKYHNKVRFKYNTVKCTINGDTVEYYHVNTAFLLLNTGHHNR